MKGLEIRGETGTITLEVHHGEILFEFDGGDGVNQLEQKEVVEVYNFLKEYFDKKHTTKIANKWTEDHSLKAFIISEEYSNVIKLNAPSPANCDKILRKLADIGYVGEERRKAIVDIVDAMENTKDLAKRYTCFYRTLNKWLDMAIQRGTIVKREGKKVNLTDPNTGGNFY